MRGLPSISPKPRPVAGGLVLDHTGRADSLKFPGAGWPACSKAASVKAGLPRLSYQSSHYKKHLTMDPIEQALTDGRNRLDLFEALAMNALIQRNYPAPGTDEQALDNHRTWIASSCP